MKITVITNEKAAVLKVNQATYFPRSLRSGMGKAYFLFHRKFKVTSLGSTSKSKNDQIQTPSRHSDRLM